RSGLVSGEIVPEVLEVHSLTTANERLRRWTVEPEVPDGGIVVDRLPAFHARQKRVHEHELVDVVRELRGVGVRDHQPDVVTDDGRLPESQLLDQRVDTSGGMRHIQSVGGNGRSANARQVWSNDGEIRGQARYQRSPHPGRFGVAVYQDDRRPVAGHEVLQLEPIYGCRSHSDGRSARLRLLRGQ